VEELFHVICLFMFQLRKVLVWECNVVLEVSVERDVLLRNGYFNSVSDI